MYGFFSGFTSEKHLERFLIASVVLAIIFSCMVSLLVYVASCFLINETIITYSENGISISKINRKEQIFYLPASEIWRNSSFEVKKGKSVKINVSGKVNLSVDKLVLSTREERYPVYSWVGATGARENNSTNNETTDKTRKLLVDSNSSYGALLMCPVAKNHSGEFTHCEEKIYKISKNSNLIEYENDTDNTIILFFTVNDLVFKDGDQYKKSYIRDVNETRQRLDKHHTFGFPDYNITKKIVTQYIKNQEKLWEIMKDDSTKSDYWFLDNIGGFTIFIEEI